MILDTASGVTHVALNDAGSPFALRGCTWKGNEHLICSLSAQTLSPGAYKITLGRTLVVAIDGSRAHEIGARPNDRSLGLNQFSGSVIDLLPGDPDNVLMEIEVDPEYSTGTLIAETRQGLSVQRIGIDGRGNGMIEQPNRAATEYITDGKGRTRAMSMVVRNDEGVIDRTMTWHGRTADNRRWHTVGTYDLFAGRGLEVLAVDQSGDGLLALKPLDGRQALYRIAADGSGHEELLFASGKVDVDGLLQIGRYRRPVAAQYTLDATQYHYFDPALARLSAGLARALPQRPQVYILDESDGGQFDLVYAESGDTPGKYYRYEAATHRLAEVLGTRPPLENRALGTVRVVSYPAADGVAVPSYLTLPPGMANAKRLPAIVLPHGGPGARDSLGFDWLAQFFAVRGYAVLQPNFRGSSGYGDQWFVNNGFKSWRTAIGDVNAGARWMIAQGIADPARVGIFGWSYGGYAALQANVTEAKLYKAAVAVAPVTDLALLKQQSEHFTNEKIEKAYIGDGPHITEGSPAHNARAITAPVLIFHGDHDLTVDIAQSRRMVSALRSAGHPAELVVFPGLDHQLADGDARAKMLARAGAFLDEHLAGAAALPATEKANP